MGWHHLPSCFAMFMFIFIVIVYMFMFLFIVVVYLCLCLCLCSCLDMFRLGYVRTFTFFLSSRFVGRMSYCKFLF